MITSAVAAVGPTAEVRSAAADTVEDAFAAAAAAATDASASAADAATDASVFAADAATDGSAFAAAASAAAVATDVAAANAAIAAAVWSAVALDADRLSSGTSPEDVMSAPLWPDGRPPDLDRLYADLMRWFSDTPGFSFWARWLRVMEGAGAMNWAMQTEIALIENDVWKAGPESVADRIAEIERRYLPAEIIETLPIVESLEVDGGGEVFAAPITDNAPDVLKAVVDRAVDALDDACGKNYLNQYSRLRWSFIGWTRSIEMIHSGSRWICSTSRPRLYRAFLTRTDCPTCQRYWPWRRRRARARSGCRLTTRMYSRPEKR